MQNKLSEFLTINRQFLRSVRLDADFGRIDALQGYILQPSAQSLLDTTAKYLLKSQQRAFTWTGPYGGGKSSLALALASLAGGDKAIRQAARVALNVKQNKNIQKIFGGNTPWTVLPIVGKRTSIIDEIGEAIDAGLPGVRGRKPLQNGRRNVIAELVRAAESTEKNSGILLIIDELGKFLEFASHNEEDIGFYQDLAEAASRCKGNLIVIGVLHQAFEQYASKLGQIAQQEWAKVQGRFVDIPLIAGADETLTLLGRAIESNYPHPSSLKIAEKIAKILIKRRPGIGTNYGEMLDACWPLHPVTAAMLGPTFKKRFGQNERSVFSFLASAEILSFREVSQHTDADPTAYYWPYQFWDYLRANFEPAILSSSDSHRWASNTDAIERTEARFSSLHVNIVKTVGLIELVRNGSGLAAEKDLLIASVDAADNKLAAKAIDELVAASILIFRKHLDAYGIYAGSDFDITAAINNAKIHTDGDFYKKLNQLVDLGPITARRHYWNTGAMRWFARTILDEKQVTSYASETSISGNQCGEFILLLNSQNKTEQDFHKGAKKLSNSFMNKGLLIGVPSNIDKISDLANEAAALNYVRENSKELHGDNIATREIMARIQATNILLTEELKNSFQTSTWYYRKKVSSLNDVKELSSLASFVADSIYSLSASINSELVNRNNLSSNAAKAQRELLHAMLNNVGQENLGYTSFSADAGIYYTVVKALGLYHEDNDGSWNFSDPHGTERSHSILDLWEKTKELVFSANKLTTLSELYEIWTAPPFGVKKGVLPILALSFFMTYRSQLALYIEGMFIPNVTDAHIDEWLQDPKRIAWRFIELHDKEHKFLNALSSELRRRLKKEIPNNALDSARALVSMLFQLPMWTRRTNHLSKDAKNVRQLLLHAADPHKVLFADIPLILDIENPVDLAKKIAEISDELLGAFNRRLKDAEQHLFKALDQETDLSYLNKRGEIVAGLGADFKLDAFAIRISEYVGSLSDIEGLLMLALGKPSKDWTDHDIDAGEMQLASWALEFRRLETLAQIRGRPATRRAIGIVFGSKKTITGSVDVSEQDDSLIEELAEKFKTQLNKSSIKDEIFLAAIAEVGASILEKLNSKKEEDSYE